MRKRYIKYILVPALVLSFAIVLAPILGTFGWHLFNSPAQTYGPYTIAVPISYVMRKSPEKATLLRIKVVPSRRIYQFALIIVKINDGVVTKAQLESWSDTAFKTIAGSRYADVVRYEISFDDVPLACISRQQEDIYARRAVVCRGLDNTLIQYVGDDEGVGEMKSILVNAQRKKD